MQTRSHCETQTVDHGPRQKPFDLSSLSKLCHLLANLQAQAAVLPLELAFPATGAYQVRQACPKLRLAKRLRDVVVRPGVQGLDATLGARLRGEEDDRGRTQLGVVP